MTIQEWLDKADNEGSVIDGFEYGLSADDLDEDVDPKFRALVEQAWQEWRNLEPIIYRIAEWEDDE